LIAESLLGRRRSDGRAGESPCRHSLGKVIVVSDSVNDDKLSQDATGGCVRISAFDVRRFGKMPSLRQWTPSRAQRR